tara:strand:- start:6149 stop:7222 length:1074 start_codon:yes stop_codon:yes gene_type:complete
MRELFESTIERLLRDISTPEYIRAAESGIWSGDLWGALVDNGILLAGAPEAVGGSEANWSELFVIARAAGQFAAPVPLVEMLLGNWLLERAGLGACSEVLTIGVDCDLRLDGNKISGEIRQVPWGRHAELIVVVAGLGGETKVLLLETAAADKVLEADNIAGEPRDTLYFDKANIMASAPLPDGIARSVLMTGGAMLRSAQMAGALTALMELTSDYAAERKQFGRPIAAFQAIQQQLAVLAEQTAAANIAAEAAFVESDDNLASFVIAAAKISSAEAASLGAAIGHSVHGAIGFTQEYKLHLLTRRLWAWRGEYGSSTFWSKLLGAHVCAAGVESFWPTLTHAHLQELIVPTQGSYL